MPGRTTDLSGSACVLFDNRRNPFDIRTRPRTRRAHRFGAGDHRDRDAGRLGDLLFDRSEGFSPLLANLYLHYAFDLWMVREFPGVPFERYADDVICHCSSEAQAAHLKDAIA